MKMIESILQKRGEFLSMICVVGAASLMLGVTSSAKAQDDGGGVLAMQRDLALVLSRDGFEAFAEQFHDDFTVWIDGRLIVRADYLPAVAAWRAAGNGAISTQIWPVSVDVFDEFALSRYVLRENFVDGTSFVGRFVSLVRLKDGCWQTYRTTVFTLYRGPSEDAPEQSGSQSEGANAPPVPESRASGLSRCAPSETP